MEAKSNGTQIQGEVEARWGFLLEYLFSSNLIKWAGISLLWFWATSFFQLKRPRIRNTPVHGSRGFWEPTFLLKIRFIYDAYNIINNGYAKVRRKRHISFLLLITDILGLILISIGLRQFKNIPFVVRRLDTDIHIMPMKYLDELRLLPRAHLNGKMVHYNVCLSLDVAHFLRQAKGFGLIICRIFSEAGHGRPQFAIPTCTFMS